MIPSPATKLWRSANEPLWPVVERHFEEAEFLAEQWRDAFDEPDVTLESLADGLERRLLAHLDALIIAGPSAPERLHWPHVRDPDVDVSTALVSGLGILATAGVDACRDLLALLDASTIGDERWQGVSEALGLSDRAGLDDWLLAELGHDNRGARVAGIVFALTRRCVRLDRRLDELLRSDEPAVLAAAATLARTGDARQLQTVVALAGHADPRVVIAAIETCLIRGVPGTIELARDWAQAATDESLRTRALAWLGLFGNDEDQRRLIERLADPAWRRAALWGLSFRGTVEAVDAVLPWLADDEFGPLAGEVVCAIAGVSMDDDKFWQPRPQADIELPPLADEHLDAALGIEPEALLPMPNAEALAAWWASTRDQHRGQRFIMGAPLDHESLTRALREAPLRRRHALALLAQARSPELLGRLATRDWAHRQLRAH